MNKERDYITFIWDLDNQKQTTQTESLSSQIQYDSQTINRRITETQPR
jgi:hypothetical protein